MLSRTWWMIWRISVRSTTRTRILSTRCKRWRWAVVKSSFTPTSTVITSITVTTKVSRRSIWRDTIKLPKSRWSKRQKGTTAEFPRWWGKNHRHAVVESCQGSENTSSGAHSARTRLSEMSSVHYQNGNRNYFTYGWVEESCYSSKGGRNSMLMSMILEWDVSHTSGHVVYQLVYLIFWNHKMELQHN